MEVWAGGGMGRGSRTGPMPPVAARPIPSYRLAHYARTTTAGEGGAGRSAVARRLRASRPYQALARWAARLAGWLAGPSKVNTWAARPPPSWEGGTMCFGCRISWPTLPRPPRLRARHTRPTGSIWADSQGTRRRNSHHPGGVDCGRSPAGGQVASVADAGVDRQGLQRKGWTPSIHEGKATFLGKWDATEVVDVI